MNWASSAMSKLPTFHEGNENEFGKVNSFFEPLPTLYAHGTHPAPAHRSVDPWQKREDTSRVRLVTGGAIGAFGWPAFFIARSLRRTR